MKLAKTEIRKWAKHCRQEYPKEACALVVAGKVIPVANSAESPTTHFRIEPEVYAPALIAGTLQAVLHSHVITLETPPKRDPRGPSAADMSSWIAMNIPFGISAVNEDQVSDLLWLDDSVDRPLEGREFLWGYSDCYTLVRDYYKQALGIKLKNYSRGEGWDEAFNFIVDRYADSGFTKVEINDLREHDLIVFQVRAPVPNHLAVVTGTNEMLHQYLDRLSGKDTIAKWSKHIAFVLRHKDLI